jgi:hypothetical protein
MRIIQLALIFFFALSDISKSSDINFNAEVKKKLQVELNALREDIQSLESQVANL